VIRLSATLLLLLFSSFQLVAQEAEQADAGSDTEAGQTNDAVEAETIAGTSPDQPRAMSGMSILGNEEAPKALVIVPWKSSELGDELSMSDNLDDSATPIDKEVFLRELRYYEIRERE